MSGFLASGRLRRPQITFGSAAAALLAAGVLMPGAAPAAAGYATIEPAAGSATLPGMPRAPAASLLARAARAPWERAEAAQPRRPTEAARSGSTEPASAALPQSAGGEIAGPHGIDIARWGIGPRIGAAAAAAEPGRPLYLWMTIEGGEAAVDRLRANGPIAIEVHWARAGAGPGAPALTTQLRIGRSGLAPVFAGEVARQGHFEWHSWARKDSLSAGQWTVSLTYPDGRPLMCGQSAPQPCRFSITVG